MLASAALGIEQDDAIRFVLACQSCADDDMRLVYSSPRSIAREFAAQVLFVEVCALGLRRPWRSGCL